MTRHAWLVVAPLILAGALRGGAQPPDTTDLEHFKYGSVGIEAEEGVPYWIWQALPRVFADLLPGGYASLGFIWEPGRELPIGFSTREVLGSTRVAINCAFCHTATYRVSAGAPRQVVPGGAGTLVSPQRFARFLQAAAADPRFTASTLLPAISQLGTLTWFDSLAYRLALIPGTRRALLRHREEFGWMDRRPDWGPGRIDSINPFKFRQLQQPVDESIGTADMTPLWSLPLRDGRALHWDGLNPSLAEALVGSALGNGASVRSVDVEAVTRVGAWLRDLRPPAWPLPVDAGLAARGRGIFDQACAACHAPDGARMGTVIPQAEVGTDAHRLRSWTAPAARAFNALAGGRPWQMRSYRTTDGYVAMPLDGVWLNAPYLHNGSVPTLQALLADPADRPTRFHRGYDVLDATEVGFLAGGPEAERDGVLFETARPGNGNQGHVYGTGLADDDKRALLEYLKTL